MSVISSQPLGAVTDARLDSKQMHLWAPAVDGILRRFNEDATRAEAALSAVYMLQAMKTVGVFNPPAVNAPRQATFMQAASGQRPRVDAGAIADALDKELNAASPLDMPARKPYPIGGDSVG